MIDYLRKPVRAVIRNLAILPGVDPNRLLPLGGTTGQFPMKASDEDGDIEWADFQVDDELSLDSEFPVQNKVLASEIYQLQSQLDGIPFPSSDNPLMDGEADPGESPDFARADHVHPSEVFWATYGTTTYNEIGAALTAGKLVMCEYGGIYYSYHYRIIDTRYFTSEGGYWITVTSGNVWAQGQVLPPSAATATPLMDGTAAVGSSSKYAKEDHVHPIDTSREPARITFTASGASMSQLSVSWPSGKTAGQLAIAPNPLYAEIDYVIQLPCVSRAITMPDNEYEFVFTGVDVSDGANHPKIGVLVVTAASASATSGTGVYTTYSLT